MSKTKVASEQLNFNSANTGAGQDLDAYLEAAEIGGRALADLLGDIFDTDGNSVVTAMVAWKGTWTTATSYAIGDTFKDPATSNIYVTLKTHSSDTISNDVAAGNIYLVIDVAASTAAAAASATAAATSETNAASSATTASNAAATAVAAASGIRRKDNVKAATTGNITLSGEQTIDGIALVTGDRVLAKDQTAASENGIYIVDAGAWTRATDLDAWAEVPNAVVAVEQGTVNADRNYQAVSDSGGTIDVTAMTWSQFGGGDLVSSNNLSDLSNPATARTNLDVPQKVATTVDNALVRSNGTTGEQQATNVIVDDDDNVSGHGATFVADATTARTLTASDNGKIIRMTSASANTVTLPQTTTETLPAGFSCTIVQAGAGTTSLAIEGSDTLNGGSTSLSITQQYGAAFIAKVTAGSPNAWEAYGAV